MMKYKRLHQSNVKEEEESVLITESSDHQQNCNTGKVNKLVQAMQRIMSMKERPAIDSVRALTALPPTREDVHVANFKPLK
ncbi:hypothetical protein FRX31_012689 [Thalictrum thalictroides]|uniref:Uncharacterized protein n=1 Tax=Thalictrum thalictroides TaxID=46969 RepID=A0A7J6WK07_THATH|nr:hypothetical protein FRX31_012689 [Thalictrum thalictroides]